MPPPDTQCDPAGQYCDEQLPMQSLAAHDGGLKLVEQHFDQQAALATHPRQNQRPATSWQLSPVLLLHWMPHTVQF